MLILLLSVRVCWSVRFCLLSFVFGCLLCVIVFVAWLVMCVVCMFVLMYAVVVFVFDVVGMSDFVCYVL